MAKLKISWVLPTTRESGKPLKVEDINHVRVEISADGGANYGLLGTYTPDILEALVDDLDFGTWTVRGTVVDGKGRESRPVTAAITHEDTSPPSELQLLLELA